MRKYNQGNKLDPPHCTYCTSELTANDYSVEFCCWTANDYSVTVEVEPFGESLEFCCWLCVRDYAARRWNEECTASDTAYDRRRFR